MARPEKSSRNGEETWLPADEMRNLLTTKGVATHGHVARVL